VAQGFDEVFCDPTKDLQSLKLGNKYWTTPLLLDGPSTFIKAAILLQA
jgi:hypothetical protein